MRIKWKYFSVFLVLPLYIGCSDSAPSTEIKVGDSFTKLRTTLGFPSNVAMVSNEQGSFETIYIDGTAQAYVFNAKFGSAMDIKPNDDFVICKIVDAPEHSKAFTCD